MQVISSTTPTPPSSISSAGRKRADRLFVQRTDGDAPAGVGVGIVLARFAAIASRSVARALDRGAGLQPSDDAEIVNVAIRLAGRVDEPGSRCRVIGSHMST